MGNIDLTTVFAIGALVTVLEELIDSRWNLDGWKSLLRTWVVGACIGAAGYLSNLFGIGVGLFADLSWASDSAVSQFLSCVIVGFLSAVAANANWVVWEFLARLGITRASVVKVLLELFRLRPPIEDR